MKERQKRHQLSNVTNVIIYFGFIKLPSSDTGDKITYNSETTP